MAFFQLLRSQNNPILFPDKTCAWRSQAIFNAGALFLDGGVHLVYRAVGELWQSVLGYAYSQDGLYIQKQSDYPIYFSPFSGRQQSLRYAYRYPYCSGGSYMGAEDPRLTQIEQTIVMTYTAFDGYHPPGVAMTSIQVSDFLKKNWCWKSPILLSHPGSVHKNWVFFPEKIQGKYALLHSINPKILITYLDTLDIEPGCYIQSHYGAEDSRLRWDNFLRGVGPPPMRVSEGWLLLYHAMEHADPGKYKLGAMILDAQDPTRILARSPGPLLEPKALYETKGYKGNVIYSCGAVIFEQTLYVYYGAADSTLAVAIMPISQLRESLVAV